MTQLWHQYCQVSTQFLDMFCPNCSGFLRKLTSRMQCRTFRSSITRIAYRRSRGWYLANAGARRLVCCAQSNDPVRFSWGFLERSNYNVGEPNLVCRRGSAADPRPSGTRTAPTCRGISHPLLWLPQKVWPINLVLHHSTPYVHLRANSEHLFVDVRVFRALYPCVLCRLTFPTGQM
jgi:hypothetical protein